MDSDTSLNQSMAPVAPAEADVAGGALGDDRLWQAIWQVLPKREGDQGLERKARLQWALAIAGGADPGEVQSWAEAYAEQVAREGTKPWYVHSVVTCFREQHWRKGANAAVSDGIDAADALAWRVARDRLEALVGASAFKLWLAGLALVAAGPGFVRLGAPTLFLRDGVRTRYGPTIERVTGKAVEVVLAEQGTKR